MVERNILPKFSPILNPHRSGAGKCVIGRWAFAHVTFF
jgi:hypothetical protein